jgi:Homeodomain-like domain
VPWHAHRGVLPRPRRDGRARAAGLRAVPGPPAVPEFAVSNRIVYGIWGGLTGPERRALQSGWLRAARRGRDQAILAVDAAGFTAEEIARSFGLSRMTVTRIVRSRNRSARGT